MMGWLRTRRERNSGVVAPIMQTSAHRPRAHTGMDEVARAQAGPSSA